MSDTPHPNAQAADLGAQLARLREQVEALLRERVAPTATEAVASAEAAMCGAMKTAERGASEVAGCVRQRPLFAVAIAAMVGFVCGRVCRF